MLPPSECSLPQTACGVVACRFLFFLCVCVACFHNRRLDFLAPPGLLKNPSLWGSPSLLRGFFSKTLEHPLGEAQKTLRSGECFGHEGIGSSRENGNFNSKQAQSKILAFVLSFNRRCTQFVHDSHQLLAVCTKAAVFPVYICCPRGGSGRANILSMMQDMQLDVHARPHLCSFRRYSRST